MASLRQIAKKAGVSPTTVSRVLNDAKYADQVSEACRKRVQEIAREAGYQSSYHRRAIQKSTSETIAMALPFGQETDRDSKPDTLLEPLYHGLIAGIESAMHGSGYSLSLVGPGRTKRAEELGIAGLNSKRYDALIIPTPTGTYAESCDQLCQSIRETQDDSRIVQIDYHKTAQSNHPSIYFDEAKACQMVLEHLYALGHRNVLMFNRSHTSIRDQYYQTMGKKMGMTVQTETVDIDCEEKSSLAGHTDMTEATENSMLIRLATGPHDYTAIIGYNDSTAMGIIRALHRAGKRIPEDVSVVGWDNTLAPFASPAMTSIDSKFVQMGREAGKLAIKLASAEEHQIEDIQKTRIILEPELICRTSTASPRQNI
jgi:LacI family transcriptional regulator